MLTEDDRTWIAVAYPNLVSETQRVSGSLAFTATYNEQIHRFQILGDGVDDRVGGRRLAGNFRISIYARLEGSVSRLPALNVEDVEPIADRHFNQSDNSACLCSPLEEQDFLTPHFEFRPFFEQLVIPFLYGQIFYSDEKRWPWFEYGHGAIGLLESYAKMKDPTKARECLTRLPQDIAAWPRIRQALNNRTEVKGSTRCFCKAADLIRRCHPVAWYGIRQLKQDISTQRLVVP